MCVNLIELLLITTAVLIKCLSVVIHNLRTMHELNIDKNAKTNFPPLIYFFLVQGWLRVPLRWRNHFSFTQIPKVCWLNIFWSENLMLFLFDSTLWGLLKMGNGQPLN